MAPIERSFLGRGPGGRCGVLEGRTVRSLTRQDDIRMTPRLLDAINRYHRCPAHFAPAYVRVCLAGIHVLSEE